MYVCVWGGGGCHCKTDRERERERERERGRRKGEGEGGGGGQMKGERVPDASGLSPARTLIWLLFTAVCTRFLLLETWELKSTNNQQRRGR